MKFIIALCYLFISPLLYAQNKYAKYVDSLTALGKQQDALTFLKKELSIKPNNEDALRAIGLLQLQTGIYDEAIASYSKAATINAKCANCFTNMAIAYAYLKNKPLAIENINKAIALEPKYSNYYISKAEILASFNMNRDAVNALKEAKKLDPKSTSILVYCAKMLVQLNEKILALDNYEEAIALAPKNDTIYYDRCELYYANQLFTEALEDVNKAIAINTKSDTYYTARGAIYAAIDKQDSAALDYKKAIALNADNYTANFNLYLLAYKQENMDLSCEYLAKTIAVAKKTNVNKASIAEFMLSYDDACNNKYANYYFQRGIALYNLEKYKEAIAIYNEGLKTFKEDAFLKMFLANALSKQLQMKDAIDLYKNVVSNDEKFIATLKSNPRYFTATIDTMNLIKFTSYGDCYKSIGYCYLSLGNFDDAMLYTNKALALKNSIAPQVYEESLLLRARIYNEQGNLKAAKNDIDDAIRFNNTNLESYYLRALLKYNLAISEQEANSNKVRIMKLSFGIDGYGRNWEKTMPVKTWQKPANTQMLNEAIADCNKMLSLKANTPEAFYLRGICKMQLKQNDFCLDILKAASLGLQISPEVLNNCK